MSARKCFKVFWGAFKKIIRHLLGRSLYERGRKLKIACDHRKELAHALCYPTSYFFLMTNYCNARCIFCNQRFDPLTPAYIRYDDFLVMLSHIPVEAAKDFIFSGGGEPLLNPDLLKIIAYVNERLPWINVTIRTNGFLIGTHAEKLAQLKINRLEISVHGTADINNRIVQRQDSEEIFQGIARLNTYLAQYHSPLRKMFVPVVSRQNMESIPGLLEKAAELHVEEFVVEFSRFPSCRKGESPQLDPADSLYFSQEPYNQLMHAVKARADELGVVFFAAFFGEGIRHDQCCQPWMFMLVDWEGDVYPCTGGEEWFKKKVKSQEYHFCNLLKEDVRACWNNPLYKRLRKTCSPRYKEHTIPECTNCHMSICLQGPDAEASHIIRQEER